MFWPPHFISSSKASLIIRQIWIKYFLFGLFVHFFLKHTSCNNRLNPHSNHQHLPCLYILTFFFHPSQSDIKQPTGLAPPCVLLRELHMF